MLTTIISDMGNVLIRYEPETFLERRGIEQAQDRELLLQEVFYSPLWAKLDLGELDEAGLEEQILPRLPEKFRSLAHDLIFHWDEPILHVPGMAELLQECKDAGLGLYLLSNASRRQPTIGPEFPAVPCLTEALSLHFSAAASLRRKSIRLHWINFTSRQRSAFLLTTWSQTSEERRP